VSSLWVCSSGGHLVELMQLKDVAPTGDRLWVTFDTADARSLLAGESVVYAHHPTNRNAGNLLRNLVLAFRVCRRVRPTSVITTGAGVAVPFCYLARVFGARVVYIESFARVSRPSLSGRLIHPIANGFFVQWPELCRSYRKAEFRGALF
jgi:beta-1,4-N-acetylglucosaminyltransferase